MVVTSIFVEQFRGVYIAGYRYDSGKRIVSVYVKSVYRGKYTWTLDYTYAKCMTYATAKKHAEYIHDHKGEVITA